MFIWDKTTDIGMMLDLEMTNRRLRAVGFAQISGPSDKVSRVLPVGAGPFLPTDENMFACLSFTNDTSVAQHPDLRGNIVPCQLALELIWLYSTMPRKEDHTLLAKLSNPVACDRAFRSIVATNHR